MSLHSFIDENVTIKMCIDASLVVIAFAGYVSGLAPITGLAVALTCIMIFAVLCGISIKAFDNDSTTLNSSLSGVVAGALLILLYWDTVGSVYLVLNGFAVALALGRN